MRCWKAGWGGWCAGWLLAGWAGVATAGSFVTPLNYPMPTPIAMTRNAQAWFGDRTDPVSGLMEVGLWKDGNFIAFPEGFDARSISDDATVVSGAVFTVDWSNGFPPTITNTGYLWNNGVLSPMASAGEENAYGASVSANGQVVVGTVYLTGQPSAQAFRMEGGVKTLLGTLAGDNASYGQFVTADGSMSVAESHNTETFNTRVYTWRDGVLTEMPDLPGADIYYGCADYSTIMAVSDDGSTLVGTGSGPEGWKLVRWVDGQIEVLWYKTIDSYKLLNDVTSDGKIISVNAFGYSNGQSYGGSMIWREELGIRSFERYASFHHGLDLGLNPGDMVTVTKMTPDGRYFSYFVEDVNYNRRGSFIAYLDPADFVVPEPSTVCLGVMATVGLMWSARRKLAARV